MSINVNEADKVKSNFFYSANSEAYQDAFLSWIILNFNSDENSEVKKFSKYFINKLLNDCRDEITITVDDSSKIELDRQVHKSDISVVVNTNQGKHLVIIEDKVGSAIHSSNKKGKDGEYKTQLLKYFDLFLNDEKYFDYFINNRVHLFVYKNQFIDNVEKKQIKVSNEGWIDLIVNFKVKIQSMIDELKSKKYKRKSDELKRNDKVVVLEKRKEAINELLKREPEFNWIPLGIEKIYDVFNDYNARTGGEVICDVILNEYFQLHKLWNDSYHDLINNNYIIHTDEDMFKVLWNDRSWLWEVFFYQLTQEICGNLDKLKDGSNDGCIFIAPASSGYYWVWSFHSANDVYSINLDARAIIKSIQKKEAFSISINLNSPLYGDKDVFGLNIVKNKPTSKVGVIKRREFALKIQEKVKENYKGEYKINLWKEIVDLESKLDNTVSKFYFELSEYSVREIADAVSEVLFFAEKYIDNITL